MSNRPPWPIEHRPILERFFEIAREVIAERERLADPLLPTGAKEKEASALQPTPPPDDLTVAKPSRL